MAMTGHSGQSVVTVGMIIHRRADQLDLTMRHIRGTGRRRTDKREQRQEQAQHGPARDCVAPSSPCPCACSHSWPWLECRPLST